MRFVRSRWIIAMLVLAMIFVGAGIYFNTEPEWTQKTYPNYYNQGISDYEDGKSEQAYNQFIHVGSMSKDSELKSLAFFNAGTMLGELVDNEKLPVYFRYQIAQQAIKNLERAVDIDPNNEEAKYNLEYLRNKQRQLFIEMITVTGPGEEPSTGQDYSPGYSPGRKDKGY